jgi:hypothetical protein|tara:strand:- start:243 stop:707 length:465 start_codon:yes stop_codon:yes gene_type:complete
MQKLFVQPPALIRWFAKLCGKIIVYKDVEEVAFLSGKNREDKPADPYWQKQVAQHWVDVPLEVMPVKDHDLTADYIWASSHYLTETLPHDYEKWEDLELDGFLVDHSCDEYANASDIWDNIDRLATSVRMYIESHPDFARGREEHELGSGVDED